MRRSWLQRDERSQHFSDVIKHSLLFWNKALAATIILYTRQVELLVMYAQKRHVSITKGLAWREGDPKVSNCPIKPLNKYFMVMVAALTATATA